MSYICTVLYRRYGQHTARVGEYLLNRDSATAWNRHYYRVKGNRHYELTNHLGNVLAVVTDRKMAKDTTADATYTPQFFMPDVYSVQNHYAFGQSMPNWSSAAAVNDPKKYRFGYNGKEDDDEWGKQDYGFRISDPRIGRFLSVDPLSGKFPYWSPYAFAGNTPIYAIDLDGGEIYGYMDLKNQSEFKIALKLLDQVQCFTTYMQETFSNAKVGDNLGATKNGQYATVPLYFLGKLPGSDGIISTQNADGSYTQESTGPKVGKTSVGIMGKSGEPINILKLDEAQIAAVKSKKTPLAVFVELEPKNEPANQLLTIQHEVILHAERNAKLIDNFNNGAIKTFEELKATYEAKVGTPERDQPGHQEVVKGTGTYADMVNETSRVLKQKNYAKFPESYLIWYEAEILRYNKSRPEYEMVPEPSAPPPPGLDETLKKNKGKGQN
jgi:RHS repeat-associated protein